MEERFKKPEENSIPEDQITPEAIKDTVMEFFPSITPDKQGITINNGKWVKSTLRVSEDSSFSDTTCVAYDDPLMTTPLATHQILTERAEDGGATSRENYSIFKNVPGHLIRIQLSEANDESKILINYAGRRGPPENFEKSELIFIAAVLKINLLSRSQG